MNIFQKISVFLIRGYQMLLRPLFPNVCIFHAHGLDSCSEYTKKTIIQKGLFQGVILGMYRIIRCHPWQKNFSDPK
jgi:putative membrane protein insertion efficiency factor